MAILLGIDGTGAHADSEYRRDFAHSFVHRICSQSRSRLKRYDRGPDAGGGGLYGTANRGTLFIIQSNAAHPDEPVLLTGYSRGGAGVIQVAKWLGEIGIQVEAMILFDAVDRDRELSDCSRIPTNVAHVVHARRNIGVTYSRPSFGNCGLQFTYPPTHYVQRLFSCTHGGVGGTPWTGGRPSDLISESWELESDHTLVSYAQDQAVSPLVWLWVQPYLSRFGFI
jgi:hypothetical protein